MATFILSDEAVLSGTLTWEKPSGYGRTTALFTLTLTLSLSQYPNATLGGVVLMPGGVEFGDGDGSTGGNMEVSV